MPNMDGIWFVKEFRALNSHFIVIDNRIEQGKKATCATGWIIKPFNPEQLLKTINKVLM